MNRRQFTKTGLTATFAASAGISLAADEKRSYFEMRTYELRNDLDRSKVQNFIKDSLMPMLKESGVGKIGCFNASLGRRTPSIILLIEYKSADQFLVNSDRISGNGKYINAWKEFETSEQMPYVRYESVLMKGFKAFPELKAPAKKEGGRIFELRTYESRDAVKSAAKIDMFNEAEIKIFEDCGFSLVFFGEGLIGTRLPHLTYMVAFDDMAARDKGWSVFQANPDWNRIKGEPRWAGTVSNIHASFLRAAPFSDIS